MFIYFDLGNVIAFFDRDKSCRQMGAVAELTPHAWRKWSSISPLNDRYERGEISSREFYDAFCSATGAKPEFNALLHAKADIFQLNYSLLPLIAALEDAELRLGLLSNTSPCHWDFLSSRGYGNLPHAFAVRALSYEVGALEAGAEDLSRGGGTGGSACSGDFLHRRYRPATSRRPANASFDAVQYTTTPKLVTELRKRGLTFNF